MKQFFRVSLVVVALGALLGCGGGKRRQTELRMRSERVVLPPQIEESKVEWNGRRVRNNSEITPPGDLVITLKGTPGVEARADFLESLEHRGQRVGEGEYRVTIPIKKEDLTGDRFTVRTWLHDPMATPDQNSLKTEYEFRIASAPVVREPVHTGPASPDPVKSALQRAREEVANLGRVYFGHDRQDLSSAAAETVEGWVHVVQKYENVMFRVAGGCDDSGADDYNFDLGRRRAVSTKLAMAAAGADAGRIDVQSRGREEAGNCRSFSGRSREECREKDRWARLEVVGQRQGP